MYPRSVYLTPRNRISSLLQRTVTLSGMENLHTQTTPIVDFGQWSVEHIRLTVCHPQGVQTSKLWELLMGVRPESIEERPREALIQQQGEVDGNLKGSLLASYFCTSFNYLPNSGMTHVFVTKVLATPPKGSTDFCLPNR